MSRTNRQTQRIRPHDPRPFRVEDPGLSDLLEVVPEPNQLDALQPGQEIRAVLDAVIRAHRWRLVQTAHRHLRRRSDAEDVVQDVCLDALEGRIALSGDPTDALADLVREVADRCRASRRERGAA
jgi:DNA-directed RNA polymerase specialized sigma24 family protein